MKRFFDFIQKRTGWSPAEFVFVTWGVVPLCFVWVMCMFTKSESDCLDNVRCSRRSDCDVNMYFLHKSGVKYVVPFDKFEQFMEDFNFSNDILDFKDVDKETFDFASNALVIPYPDDTKYHATNFVENVVSRQ